MKQFIIRLSLLPLLAAFMLVSACLSHGDNENELPLINLRANIPEAALLVNDLAGNISVAVLETTESSLVREFYGFVGERYIIVLDSREILLFSATGSFICRISSRGRAPDEFNSIEAWDVDKQEKYFYYYSRGRDYISVYDLNKQMPARPVPLPEEIKPGRIVSVNDTTIAILPELFSQSGYLMLTINLSGEITSSVKTEPVPHPGAWAGRSPIFRRSGSREIAWLHSENDTLFFVKGTEISPGLLFKGIKPHTHGNVTTVTNYWIDGISEQHISIRQVSYEKIGAPGNVSITYSDDEPEHFFWYRERQGLYKMTGYLLKLGEITIELPRIETGIHGNLYCILSPTEFKEALEKATGGEVTASQLPEEIIDLYHRLSPFDNPVIINGYNTEFNRHKLSLKMCEH